MKRYLPFLIVGAVALLTLASGTMLYRAKLPPVLATGNVPAPSASPAEEIHARGDASAIVTLEEFGDYQCPPCGKLSPEIHQFEKDFGSRLRVIFRQFPLAMHQHARAAALAAEAAGLQNRFWEMHDLLYREQAAWSKAVDVQALFNIYAETVGLNVDRFKKDMEGPHAKTRVDADQERGKSLGVHSTPTFFINGKAVPPASINPPALRAAIDAAIKENTPPSSS